jgi:diguanylate cyclase (GGDEF)-like protein
MLAEAPAARSAGSDERAPLSEGSSRMNEPQPLRLELSSKCLELLYSQSANAYSASVVGGLFLGALFWNRASKLVIVAWGVAYLVMIAIRHQLGVRFRYQVPGVQAAGPWLRYFQATVLICGVLWGLFGLYLAQHANSHQLAAIVITLGALVSGAVITYSVVMPVFAAFAVPALVPIVLFLMAQDTPGEIMLGLVVLVWLLFMHRLAQRFRGFALESLNYQFENVTLLHDLAEQRDKAEELAMQLKALSAIDGLTGVANRRQLDEELLSAWQRAERENHEIALILCDTDCFKAYNDTYGHLQGDACLRQIAGVLAQHAARGGGVAARYGGEEFAVLLPRTNPENALALAEHMRLAVEALAIPHETSTVGKCVTASFGVCSTTPGDGASVATLIENADKALYQAKRGGRNQVVRMKRPKDGAPRDETRSPDSSA